MHLSVRERFLGCDSADDEQPYDQALRELEEIRRLVEEDFHVHINGSVTRMDRMRILSHHRQLGCSLRRLMEAAEAGEIASDVLPILRALLSSNFEDLWAGLCQAVIDHASIIRETTLMRNMIENLIRPASVPVI